MIKTIIETQQLGYLLFFGLYGIDAVFTIVNRLLKKENIFEAHRSHLYQYLANELQFSHLQVAFGYALLQLVINGLLLYLDDKGLLSLAVSMGILFFLTLSYLCIRMYVLRRIATTDCV